MADPRNHLERAGSPLLGEREEWLTLDENEPEKSALYFLQQCGEDHKFLSTRVALKYSIAVL